MPPPTRAALALALGLAALPARAEDVTVFAAASLKDALDAAAAAWQAETGNTATLSYAGSSQLAAQIQQGAPADLFVSAAPEWMDALEQEGLIDPATRVDLLGNSLVLVAHGADAPPVEIGPGLDLLGLLGGGRLAMALVDSVPAGQYGRAALESLGLWASVEPSVAQAENVRAALALVATGEAPLGVVYASDAVADDAAGDRVSVVGAFPPGSHPPITYPAAAVAASGKPEARAFLDFLQTDRADAIFEAQGFTVLD